MITAKEAKELTANWVQYELKKLDPLIRQTAVKGISTFYTEPYNNYKVRDLIKELHSLGFNVIQHDYSNSTSTLEIIWT